MAMSSAGYALYLSMKLKDKELKIVELEVENKKLKDTVVPKAPPVMIKQEIPRLIQRVR